MGNRTVIPKRGKVIGNPFEVLEGLPQGSPISPILFAVLLSGIGREFPNNVKIFADDVQVMEARKKGYTFSTIEQTCNKVIARLHQRGLSIEHRKTELLVCRGKRTRNHDAEVLTVTIGGQEVKELTLVKYLGIHLDNTLSFEQHVQSRIGPVMEGVRTSAMMGGMTHGLRPRVVVTIMKTIVLP